MIETSSFGKANDIKIDDRKEKAVVHILYVDDEPGLLELCKLFLEMDGGIEVDTSTSAKSSIDELEKGHYEVVISDYKMPEMDGIQFLKALRAKGIMTPFVLFTGKGREEVAMEALNNGANFYLQKGGDPVSQFGELRHVILQLSERKRTVDVLSEKEATLDLVTSNMLDVITQIDGSGTLRYVSPSVKHVLGYDPGYLVGKNIFDYYHPEDREKVIYSFHNKVSEEKIEKSKLRVLAEDGRYVWMEASGRLLFDDDGKIKMVILSSREISDRMRAEEEVERSVSTLKAILDSTVDGILVVDPSRRIVAHNKRFLEIWGLSPGSVEHGLAKLALEDSVISLKDPAGFRNFVNDIYNSGPQADRYTAEFIDGRVVEAISTPHIFGEKVVGRIWNFHDITALKEVERDLRTSESKFRAIFERSALGILLVDPDRKAFDANDAFLTMLGYEWKDLSSLDFMKVTHPDDLSLDMEMFTDLRNGKLDHYQIKKRYLLKDKKVIWVRLTYSAVRDAAGGLRFALGIVEDITPEAEAEQLLRDKEEMYRTLATNIPNSTVALFDHTMTCTMIEGHGFADLGRSLELVKGKEIHSLMDNGTSDALDQDCRRALKGETLERESGLEGRIIRSFITPVNGDDGRIVGGMILLQDVTNIKQNEERLRRSNTFLTVLSECNQSLIRSKNEKELGDSVCKTLVTLGNYELAWIGLIGTRKDKKVHPVAYFSKGGINLRDLNFNYGEGEGGGGTVGNAIRNGELSIVEDMQDNPGYSPWRSKMDELGIGASISLPLVSNNKLMGVLAVYAGRSHHFEKDEIKLLTELAADVSFGMSSLRTRSQRWRSGEQLDRRTMQLELLASSIRQINTILEPEVILRTLSASAKQITGASACMIGRMVDDKMLFTEVVSSEGSKPISLAFESGQGAAGHVMSSMRPYISNSPETDALVIQKNREKFGIKNLAIAPIISRSGELLGAFWVHNKIESGFDEWDLSALESLATGAAVALENAKMVIELKQREHAMEQANNHLKLISRITRHDIQNQLTTLTGYLEISRMRTQEPSSKAYLDKALSASWNLRDHLSFATDYQEMGSARPEWTRLSEAMSKGASTIPLGETQIINEVGDLEVLADKMLEKVFHNLIDNSIRHGRSSIVRISAEKAGDGLRVLYQDNGSGIIEGRKGSMFEAGNGHHGMCMVREILSITGISIEENGRPGEGARFEMLVPRGNFRDFQPDDPMNASH